MKINKFEDIIAWQKSKELTLLIYSQFKLCKDYALRDQIQRAVISVSNNIAEGYERQSNKELRQFLFISKGSVGEVRSMLQVSFELGFITKESFDTSYRLAVDTSKLLSGFIKKL